MTSTPTRSAAPPIRATFVRVRGVVQGVGFRPFVYRLAQRDGLRGWVRNSADGVEIHVEGSDRDVASFLDRLANAPPPAADIASIESEERSPRGLSAFAIEVSGDARSPTVRVSPDLPVCDACLAEMADRADRRHGYPYINCTDCGPRYTILLGLPYDRAQTTMRAFAMCERCAREYDDPLDRRFHAQPTACPECGPVFVLTEEGRETARGGDAVRAAAAQLRAGRVLAIKGLGGYHLAADARRADVVTALRERKGRREKPFALMVPTLDAARELIQLDSAGEELLLSPARPIVLAPARVDLPGVSPDNLDLGVMLPYTPLQVLLFAAGAPEVLLMTSANRSNEPIAYRDEDARYELAGLADVFLIGERPIARRVDDSIACASPLGPMILRRARGLAPGAVASLPATAPLLGVGADLKNTVTLVVRGDAFMSQHIGDLEQREAMTAHRETIEDLVSLYAAEWHDLTVVHDLHPEYASTQHAHGLPARRILSVQHHRAHVAGVLAERGALDRRALGIALDGTGYGDDGTIWGGEIFLGSVAAGLERVAHLRPAPLPGGDAAARHPAQAAAGFLAELEPAGLGDPPFSMPERYFAASKLARSGVRTFRTTSTGRLFDTAAALLGWSREVTFEGQAAIWLEHLARRGGASVELPPLAFALDELDYRPTLAALIKERRRGAERAALAAGFHRALATGFARALATLAREHDTRTVVLSGGVFQNRLLLAWMVETLTPHRLEIWANTRTPPNDGGVSLGQVALAAMTPHGAC